MVAIKRLIQETRNLGPLSPVDHVPSSVVQTEPVPCATPTDEQPLSASDAPSAVEEETTSVPADKPDENQAKSEQKGEKCEPKDDIDVTEVKQSEQKSESCVSTDDTAEADKVGAESTSQSNEDAQDTTEADLSSGEEKVS